MKNAFFLLLVASFLAVSAQPALACKCDDSETVKEGVTEAGAVFAGKVAKIQGGVVTIEVSWVWKGGPMTKVITINTPEPNGAACRYPFKKDELYLVYAPRGAKGELITPLCTRTKLLAEAEQDIRELGLPMPPLAK